MSQVAQTNSIIRKLISGGEISESELKRIYRNLCKETHPDLCGGEKDKFLKLQADYKEAITYIESLKQNYKDHENVSLFQFYYKKEADNLNHENINPRLAFYDSLYRYTASGLHSARIRIKPELRERNISIISEVINWARFYDPVFIKLFIEYNKNHLRRFNEWLIEKKFVQAKNLFLKGLANFFTFQQQGLPGAQRTSQSYIEDAIYNLEQLNLTPPQQAVLNFCFWLKDELQLPAINNKYNFTGQHEQRINI